ncbi:SLBB domain-containing protein [Vibrio cidicii]|uniref:SLBB domain-containing protein n=1 Tax=Vibrio cidicii TaxID=1763883 RepID=UPI0018C33999|nr:SLBB domain-containing protein [Vibrio cidicii]
MSLRRTINSLIIVFISAIWHLPSLANPLSSEQIAQFKKLPIAQQQALAKQYGIDLSQLESGAAVNTKSLIPTIPTITPRKVNPLVNSQRDKHKNGVLKPFGYNVFAGHPSTDSPIDDLPVPNHYLLAPGDELQINMYGKENGQFSAVITREGSINIPKLGPIYLAGQSFADAKLLIEKRVKEQILGVELSISMGALRTSQISIFGDAFQPGSYNVSPFVTVTQALKAAGGIDTLGSLRSIEIKRAAETVKQIDLYDFLVKGNIQDDIRLESGDIIFIPSRFNSIYVRGEVVRPAVYETKKGETLGDVLGFAGGVSANGYLESVSVRRKLPSGIKVYDVDVSTSIGQGFAVVDGDEIVVRHKAEHFTQDIVVRGAVVRPGVREFREGIKVADILSDIKQDLNPNTDLNYALVIREINAYRDIEVLQFDLGKAISKPGSSENITLAPRDQILVFSSELDGQYWYGEGQNKTREDLQAEQLAKSLADQQREMMAYQLSLAQAQTQANNLNASTQIYSQSDWMQEDDVLLEQIGDNTSNVADSKTELNLSTLEKKEQQQQIDFDSRENLLEPVLKRLMQQAGFGSAVQIVEVRGAVKFPGVYPLARNATAKSLIVAGGGLRESAFALTSELSRVETSNGQFSIVHKRLDMAEIMGEKGINVKLQSKDRLNIFTKPEWREDYTIELLGEVVFPGTYTFRRGETLSEVIERAGGLTDFAYPKGAIFSRDSLRKQEKERMKMLNLQLRQEIASLTLRRQSASARYGTSPAEAMAIADKLDTTEPIGRLVIDLPDILKGEKEFDVLLENQDKLYIPPLRRVISVVGEVQFSAAHQFSGKLGLEDYLNKSGGTKRQADTDRIYVIRANGSVMLPNNSYWFSRDTESLEPGDTIVVPIDTDYLDSLSAWTSATQILYQIGVAWNAIQK